jgi:hypothetical protein
VIETKRKNIDGSTADKIGEEFSDELGRYEDVDGGKEDEEDLGIPKANSERA